jgi:paraquat-inducible protein B
LDAPVAEEDHKFVLYSDHDAAEAATYARSLKFISYFKGSVAGLSADSPVTLHGLRIGVVTDVVLSYEQASDTVSAAVRYDIEPGRISGLKLPGDDDPDQMVADLAHRGLRIRLEGGSIITGSKQLAMELVSGAPETHYSKQGDTYVLVPFDNGDGDITGAAAALLARLNALPFEQIGDNLNKTLAGANGVVNDPKLRQAIASLSDTLNGMQTLVAALNKGAGPLLQRLPKIATDLEDMVKHANQLVASLDDSHAPGSEFGRDMTRMLSQLSDAARSVRILADLLSRHPEALIRGRDEGVR